jgi:hypothetical protein
LNSGCPGETARFAAQRTSSLAKGFLRKSYAGSNVDEFNAELTGGISTHGGTHDRAKRERAEGLKIRSRRYALMDALQRTHRDRKAEPRRPRPEAATGTAPRRQILLNPDESCCAGVAIRQCRHPVSYDRQTLPVAIGAIREDIPISNQVKRFWIPPSSSPA